MLFADYGAEVINICSPRQAKMSLTKKPKNVWSFEGQLDLIQESLNRNKKSVTLDLKSNEGHELFLDIAKKADVVIEDFRPGVVKRLGVDYDTIRELNPGIIYCSLSGYGQDGPYRDLPGHDVNYTGMAGALDLIGEFGGPPVIPMFFLADFAGAALHSTIGILMALLARTNKGEGQYIDISFVDSLMTLLTPLAYAQLNQGITARRGETLYSGSFPCYSVYKCADGKYITIGCFEPWLWKNFCRALSVEEFIPFQMEGGVKKDDIFSSLKTIFLKMERDEWFEFLKDKNVCVGKVYSLDEVFNDPQVLHRHIVQEVKDPVRGVLKHLGPTIKLSKTPGSIRNSAPVPGQNTEEITRRFGKRTNLLSK